MTKIGRPPPPDNEKARIYSFFLWMYDALTPRFLRRGAEWAFGLISPDIPENLSADFADSAVVKAGVAGAIITFLFTFVGTLAVTYWRETLVGQDARRMYFSQDIYNLLLYAIVCPAYIGVGASLVTALVEGYGRIKNFAYSLSPSITRRPQVNLPTATFIILLIASFSICNYANDVGDIQKTSKIYWFVENSNATNFRLGFVFAYYVLLNFCLLVATLVFLGCFLSVFVTSVHVGDALSYLKDLSTLDFTVLREKLKTFLVVYICAKLLVVAYMVNFYIWAASPLAVAQGNMLVTKIALTIFGVFFISIPRYYIEYQWYLYKWRVGLSPEGESPYDDLRTPTIKLVAFFADTTLVGGFVAGVWLQPILTKAFE